MLDSVLSGCGVAVEAVLVLLLVRERVFRMLPAFFVYICWSLTSDSIFLALQWLTVSPAAYFRIYEAQMVVDSAMIFAILVELAWSLLRPIRGSLPKGSWMGIALLIAVAGAVLWPVAGLTLPRHLSVQGANFFRLQQTFAILGVVVFLAMAGFSQLLAIGWRNCELQIATGLGAFSMVSLTVTILHTYQDVGPQYHWLDQAVAASYLSALAYWVLSFATKEAERRDFTPQMENFLLLVGGAARAGRVALSDFLVTKTRFRNHR